MQLLLKQPLNRKETCTNYESKLSDTVQTYRKEIQKKNLNTSKVKKEFKHTFEQMQSFVTSSKNSTKNNKVS